MDRRGRQDSFRGGVSGQVPQGGRVTYWETSVTTEKESVST